jgi:hypothetical protein
VPRKRFSFLVLFFSLFTLFVRLKVFQYFASIKEGDESFMTPQDFMRSILPFNKLASDNAVEASVEKAVEISIALTNTHRSPPHLPT